LSHHPEPPGRPKHGEVDGLDIGRQHGQRFGLLRHTHKPQKWPVAARGEIGREGCEISSLVEHMGLSPWLFL